MLSFENFSKKYKNVTIINESNFTVNSNKITFFMGPNGAGKTTLIKCIAGLESFDGKILCDNCDIEKIREKTLIVWDDCPFYDNMSGLKNLLIMSETVSISSKEVLLISQKYFTKELLLRKVKSYSYGQRKKLALVLQLILKPKILIMDEISNGLDYDTMKQLREDIKKLSENTCVILTGHQFSFYEGIVDDVYIINNGNISNVTDEYNKDKFKLENIYERHYKNE